MSQLLINTYLNDLATLKRVSGAQRESVVREAFKDLLKAWGKGQGLVFIPEHEFISTAKVRNYVDGALMHDLRVPFGYWEAKDADDDLDAEIQKKFRRGYPQSNIVFEDSVQAVLIQNGLEVVRCDVSDGPALQNLLELFFGYQRPEIAEFRKAIIQFKADLPAVLEELRRRIDEAFAGNQAFKDAAETFLKTARETINSGIGADDIREMLIQHILTEDIFARVFGQDDFHRENIVAKALYGLEHHFFRGEVKQSTLKALEPYYAAIRSTAALISSHSEKQGFLKALYENFYKVYNPAAADRLGVVYTPNEIVRFMVESADWLCEKHFGKNLIDRDVEILDPATGTGTFIVELMEHFRGQPDKLKHKYREELHANEVAILPYYVANLNIEATYAALAGGYEEFPGLCFVDTLDNVAGLGIFSGHQFDLLGGMSDENVERVKRQNRRKISVVIGNPPYNAWQENYNQNNANRPYARVDERIKRTYVREGTAQNQSSVYDMYTRFIRWATDRVHDDGIIAFIIGRKPFSKSAYNGFRKVIAREFAEVWVLDLGGDVVDNPNLSGTVHNVFGIKVGVAICFLVKKKGQKDGLIRYARRPEVETAEDKRAFLTNVRNLANVDMQTIQPDRNHHWLDQTENDWDNLLPTTEIRKGRSRDRTIFSVSSNGLQTKRDDWTYDFDSDQIRSKIKYLIEQYQMAINAGTRIDIAIKWDRELNRRFENKEKISISDSSFRDSEYRPFTRKIVYFDKKLNSQSFRLYEIFPDESENITICLLSKASRNPLSVLATRGMFDTSFLKNGNGSTQGLARYRYLKGNNSKVENVTDWAANQFSKKYGSKLEISKSDIFSYVYAVLYDPIYRQKYELNLRRDFPRIPLYPNFAQWRDWGQALLDLHIGYEAVEPWPLERIDTPDARAEGTGTTPAVKLKSDRENGVIVLDAETRLAGVPDAAWDYRLGNRSAIDWVLDQHKEKTPKDPTVREKFNSYRFADHKEAVVELLKRVTTVSVRTMEIVEAMRAAKR